MSIVLTVDKAYNASLAKRTLTPVAAQTFVTERDKELESPVAPPMYSLAQY